MASNLYSTIYRALDSLLHMKTFHYIIPVVGTLIAVQCSCSQNAEEQALVALHVRAAVAGVTERLEEQPAESLPAGEIEHLCSRMTFRMSRRYLPQLIDELQPTPAVSGYPVRLAMEYLRRHPDTERGCYAGFLGPVDTCSARFFVMLRCMQVLPDRCRLYAGGGIMPDSCEEDEWLETEAKMEPMRRLLR